MKSRCGRPPPRPKGLGLHYTAPWGEQERILSRGFGLVKGLLMISHFRTGKPLAVTLERDERLLGFSQEPWWPGPTLAFFGQYDGYLHLPGSGLP
jgi:hypothetical protein